MRWIGGVPIILVSLAGWTGAVAGEVDPTKWAQLRTGMAEAEVVRIMGKEDRREQPAGNRKGDVLILPQSVRRVRFDRFHTVSGEHCLCQQPLALGCHHLESRAGGGG